MSEIQPRLTYYYAKVKPSTRKCMGVMSSTDPIESDALYEYIPISGFIEEYRGKYYINGAWYEDAAGTIPWAPST